MIVIGDKDVRERALRFESCLSTDHEHDVRAPECWIDQSEYLVENSRGTEILV